MVIDIYNPNDKFKNQHCLCIINYFIFLRESNIKIENNANVLDYCYLMRE